MESITQILARELDKKPEHIENVIALLDEGNTVPFIARYRKELHGAMDDTALRTLVERLEYLRSLQERRETIKKTIEEQGKLTEDLAAAIDDAATLAALEDLYRPYKPKRRTRATVAREKGLEPLALLLKVLICIAPPAPYASLLIKVVLLIDTFILVLMVLLPIFINIAPPAPYFQ